MGPELVLILEALKCLAIAVDFLANLATIVQFVRWLWKEYKHRRDG